MDVRTCAVKPIPVQANRDTMGCVERQDPASIDAARRDLTAWRGEYERRLDAPDGWWAITGLHWLPSTDDTVQIGTASDADVPLRGGDPTVATVRRHGAGVQVVPGPAGLWRDGVAVRTPEQVEGADVTFAASSDGDAARFAVLFRGDRRGVRTYDRLAARDHRKASGEPPRAVGWYDVQRGWTVRAALEPCDPDLTVSIVNILGDVMEVKPAGWLTFDLCDQPCRLLATGKPGAGLFVHFRDAGSGKESYGTGRFLSAPSARDGVTILDFHRAFHPPCAHTEFGTCPLPPLVNRLPFEVTAGERFPV